MRLLTFLARRFAWKSHSRTLDTVPEREVADEMEEAVVAFLHFEAKDEPEEERRRVFRHLLKHLKWIAGKRSSKRVVLHSFTHLGSENGAPDMAEALMEQVAERLRSTGYEVKLTPFGYFCEWELAVHGESLAKVWKEV